MRAIWSVIEHVADTDATILIRGESGVGKDFVGRAVHARSTRRAGPFIKVNCPPARWSRAWPRSPAGAALAGVLEQVHWNRAEASRILKVSYKTLLNKISQCQLTPPARGLEAP